MRKILIIAGLMAWAGAVAAQEGMKVDAMKVFKPDTLVWKDDPSLPKGAQSVLLVGDPSKAGVFVVRVKLPARYKVAPHTHPFAELITVLTGSLGNGMGETFDAKKGEMLKAGASFALPAKHAHYVWTNDEDTILELVATGPWDITYLNSADDPRKQPK